ncbi:PREDICTED: nuclear factor erythroid 2-related factor 2-like [Priapulus caudatus]|uniref:Nuclear factor erythroid 2-related factor 2-like n=1 Tax=Priapulus caudatus TaxID=37621 RepID=A0ABM1F2F6_PRICU|nr:PREDICTED: nuclear factor erythroid 2-related factor 2-like [Priapulus caudatus]
MSRDEKRVQALNVPFSIGKIVHLPIDEFTRLLQAHPDLTDVQLTVIRDVRRRGKNKAAAQSCRKRKLDNIVDLGSVVGKLRSTRNSLRREKKAVEEDLRAYERRYESLYSEVFGALRDDAGRPYSADEFSLQQMLNGSIVLVRNDGSPHAEGATAADAADEPQKGARKKRMQKR